MQFREGLHSSVRFRRVAILEFQGYDGERIRVNEVGGRAILANELAGARDESAPTFSVRSEG